MIIIIVIIILCASALSKNAMEIFVDDTSIGYVKGNSKKISATDLETTVTSQISQQIGTDIQLNEEIKAKPAHASKKNLVTTDSIISKLKDNVTYKVKAAVLYVDGEEIGVLASEKEANDFLKDFASQYISEDANLKDWEFTKNVEIKEAYVDKDKIVNTDSIRVKFTETRLEPTTYVVQSGDTLSGVASKLGTTYNQMMGDNPNLPKTLYVGQELNILLPTPYISVRTIEETEEVTVIPKETEQQVDNTKSSDYKRIVQQGSDGERKVVTQVTKVNGVQSLKMTTLSPIATLENVKNLLNQVLAEAVKYKK